MSSMPLYAAKRRFFPDPNATEADGLVAIGDDLSLEILFEAYSFGIFPWPQEDLPILWFSPVHRGILDFDEFHISKSFAKLCKKTDYEVRFNTSFSQVITLCAQSQRKGQSGTWINSDLIKAYENLHRAGFAHCTEIWQGNKLVGGLYGVYIAGVFSGESMFFKTSGASKLALLETVKMLRRNGKTWMDVQMVTPLLQSFGARYITRKEFHRRLETEKPLAHALIFQTPTSSI